MEGGDTCHFCPDPWLMTYSSARAQMSSAGKEASAIVLNMLLFVLPFKANYPLASLSP